VEAVIVRQAGDRAFCAGGDVRALIEAGVELQHRFWRDEYRMNALIRRYRKPYVAFIDGIVMGGGVGVSIHGSHRVVSEHVVFAMPECAIGMIPDVGASHDLARMPGAIGLYLGLTGARLKAADCLHVGFATHAVPRAMLDAVEAEIAFGGAASIDVVLARHAFDPGPAPIAGLRSEIDRHFDQPSVEAIFRSLAADPGEFARETLKTLGTKSPTSLKLSFRLIREARSKSVEDCLRAEWGLVSRLHEAGDFAEGVRALLIDKDNNPRWNPPGLAETSDAVIARSFTPPPGAPLDLS
jgi:enoyl-CoA hydratase